MKNLQKQKQIIENYNTDVMVKEEAAVVAGVVAVSFILNNFIIPFILLVYINYIYSIFNKAARPKLHEKYTNEIQKITNYPIQVYTIDDKKVINAWHSGTTRIFITTGLMEKLTKREIIAILLHECGHYANKDVIKRSFIVDPILNLVIIMMLLGIIMIAPPAAISASILFQNLKRILLSLTLGRGAEYLADSFAAEHGYKKDLISALKKFDGMLREAICKKEESKPTCDMLVKQVHMFDEHPEFEHRKININSEDLKYIKTLLSDGISVRNVKKSFFELRKIWKKLKKDIKEYENSKKDK